MPSFFYSYARIDREKDPNENIKRFFVDLDSMVIRLGYAGGFFDTHGIEAGANWEVEVKGALQTSRILVAMYSPQYVQRSYCNWEWTTFYEPYQQAIENGQPAGSPILPVKWLTPVTLPAQYERFQYSQDTFPKVYREVDLSQLMSSKKYKDQYQLFVRFFATRLAEMMRLIGADSNRSVSQSPSESALSGAGSTSSLPESGAQFVRLVLVAGLRNEIVPPRNFTECYGSDPERKDWRPHYPSKNRNVHDLIKEVADKEGRFLRYLRPGPELLSQIRDGEAHNNTIIVVVDPWSLSIRDLQMFVEKFDLELHRNCAVLVIWNKEDPETIAGQPLYRAQIKKHLERHITLTNTFFRESVMTVEEFQQALAEAFNKVRTNISAEGRAAFIQQGITEAQPTVSI